MTGLARTTEGAVTSTLAALLLGWLGCGPHPVAGPEPPQGSGTAVASSAPATSSPDSSSSSAPTPSPGTASAPAPPRGDPGPPVLAPAVKSQRAWVHEEGQVRGELEVAVYPDGTVWFTGARCGAQGRVVHLPEAKAKELFSSFRRAALPAVDDSSPGVPKNELGTCPDQGSVTVGFDERVLKRAYRWGTCEPGLEPRLSSFQALADELRAAVGPSPCD